MLYPNGFINDDDIYLAIYVNDDVNMQKKRNMKNEIV